MVKFDDSIDEISKKAVDMVKDLYNDEYFCADRFVQYSPCYKFSNENIASYMQYFSIRGKKVLTVCGSGDQAIASIMMGANNVDVFDSNLFSYFNMWLKIYAIKYLEFDEFIDLYKGFNLNRKDMFNKIVKKISDDVGKFWAPIFSLENDMFRYFFKERCNIYSSSSFIPFMKPSLFSLLKDCINDNKFDYENGIIAGSRIMFHCCDLFDITSYYGDGQYDFINFSNIFDYVSSNAFFTFSQNIIDNNLSEDGSILLNYCWNKIGQSCLSDNLGAYKIDLKESYDSCGDDSVMVYTKKK